MSFILNIDTAVQTSSISLSQDGSVLASRVNPSTKDSAAWLHVAIQEVFQTMKLDLSRLNAIAVSAGPGSYTGLRVGMATAKGLCYALNIPLITINTLQQMAFNARQSSTSLLCPMIDARRMEVFTAIYDQDLNVVMPVTNLILNESSFSEYLTSSHICFFGNGSEKFKSLVNHNHAEFKSLETTAESMSQLSFEKLKAKDYSDLAYLEPTYGKDFHSISKESL